MPKRRICTNSLSNTIKNIFIFAMKSDSSVEKSEYHSLHLRLREQSGLVVVKIMVKFHQEAAKKLFCVQEISRNLFMGTKVARLL